MGRPDSIAMAAFAEYLWTRALSNRVIARQKDRIS
jgi:hypothetical protein